MNFENFGERLKEQIKQETPESSEFCETHKGETPSGGTYSVAYFYDKDRKPCKRSKAAYVNVVEFSKDGKRLNEAYGSIG